MKRFTQRQKNRAAFALVVAMVGLMVSFVMIHAGGPNARMLPGLTFHVSATIGAGLAGWICAGAFGVGQKVGWAIALSGSIGMTFLGAILGSFLAGAFFDGLGAAIAFPALGIISIIDAAESPAAVLVWGVCMAGLHILAGKLNARGQFQ